ncbi:MAG: LysM peptidoglycan-binding domain-containing protein, partial [Achromobacter mucicolens]
LAEMPLDGFKALNPSFNRPVIRGDHGPTLLLPADRVEIFNANLTNYKGDLSAWKVYHSRRGESYASIAKRFGVSEATLRETNDISRRQKAANGQALLVPGDPGTGGVQIASLAPPVGALDSAPQDNKAAAPRGRAAQAPAVRVSSARPNVRSHKVRQGDTLFSLAKQYGTTVDALRALNNIKGSALKIGTQLRVPGTNARG